MTTYPIRWHKTSNGYGKNGDPIRQRESFVLIFESGAIEGWRTPEGPGTQFHESGHYGGVEVHSKTPRYDGQEPNPDYCEWTRGDCYHDGSAMAFDRIEWFFDMPDLIFAELAMLASNLEEVQS